MAPCRRRCKVRSASLVRALNDCMISWVLWSRFVKSSSTHNQSKATLVFVKKKEEKARRRKYLRQRFRVLTDHPFTLPYRNEACSPTETANEPVDPTTDQNQWSNLARMLTSLDSSGIFALTGSALGSCPDRVSTGQDIDECILFWECDTGTKQSTRSRQLQL